MPNAIGAVQLKLKRETKGVWRDYSIQFNGVVGLITITKLPN